LGGLPAVWIALGTSAVVMSTRWVPVASMTAAMPKRDPSAFGPAGQEY
jgi:hypothetical protein